MNKEYTDKQISELKNTISDLNEKLKESESLKSNFISNIMNEVYNPFSSILTLADNIMSLEDRNLSRSRDMAAFIYREASKLDFHLQNIFTAATIEAGLEEVELRLVNVSSIHEDMLRKLKIDLSDKKIKVEYLTSFKGNEEVINDPKKIVLIITNIVSNSIKFCPEGGYIEIDYKLVDGLFHITIRDNGSGINDEDINELYNRFKRFDNNINSLTGGTGLGLSVVKALIDIMEGEINIINEDGTKVSISIPFPSELPEGDEMDDSILFDEEIF